MGFEVHLATLEAGLDSPQQDQFFQCFAYNPSSIALVPSNATNFYGYLKFLKQRLGNEKYDLMLCRGSIAGGLGYLLYRTFKVPYYVESFEPHAAYMKDAGVWSKWGPKYIFQLYLEKKQRLTAAGLMTVSRNYLNKLSIEGVEEQRLFCLPCTVDLKKFNSTGPSDNLRISMGYSANDVILIYVGKFGDIYLEEEAFYLFAQAIRILGKRGKLILLTPQNQAEIREKVKAAGVPESCLEVAFVEHAQLINYLRIADVAFCTVRPGESRRYCCPIKIGEYWAMGLPIIITKGIGDDSELIKTQDAGAVLTGFSKNELTEALNSIHSILKDPNHKRRIRKLAENYRDPGLIKKAYSYFFERKLVIRKNS